MALGSQLPGLLPGGSGGTPLIERVARWAREKPDAPAHTFVDYLLTPRDQSITVSLLYMATISLEKFAEGMVSAVVLELDARDISVSDDVCYRICACTDLERLERLLQRAVTMSADEDLFV